MEFTKVFRLTLRRVNIIFPPGLIVGLISTFCAAYVYANNQSVLTDAFRPNAQHQSSFIYALNNSSLPLKSEVTKLYQLRNYDLIWSNGEKYNNNALELFEIIRQADKFGLNPLDYDAEIIQYFLESTITDPNLLRKSDITFTHAYVKLASHLEKGKYIAPSSIRDEKYSLIDILNEAIDSHAVTIALENLQPNNPNYSKLAETLKKYRSLKDDIEPIVLNQKSFTIGDQSPEVIKVRKRLYAFGDYSTDNFHNDTIDLQSDVLDESLALAISNFQYRHGLEADGILGKKTVIELNKPILERVQQLELNLERARDLTHIYQGRHLIVNIPDYKLRLIDNGQTIYESRVVVGKKRNKTPELSSEITKLVLNPYWHVPKSIASKEIIPMIEEDPHYLAKHNMKLLGTLNNQTRIINPETVDWSSINFEDTELRIRQEPGAKNSLGRVKFIFPNNYKVYLHDTPARSLFSQTRRAYSHGCIRVEDPFGLAEVLLADSESWSKDDLYSLANSNRTKTVKLEQPIPIHITYMTAWVDDQGIVNFRPDIYRRDRQIVNAL